MRRTLPVVLVATMLVVVALTIVAYRAGLGSTTAPTAERAGPPHANAPI